MCYISVSREVPRLLPRYRHTNFSIRIDLRCSETPIWDPLFGIVRFFVMRVSLYGGDDDGGNGSRIAFRRSQAHPMMKG